MLSGPNPAYVVVRKSLRSRIPYAAETAAVIIGTAVKPARPSRGRGRAKGGIARVSHSTKRTTVFSPTNAVLSWKLLFTTAANAANYISHVQIAPAYLGLAGLVVLALNLDSAIRRDLSERHGAVIYALWSRGGTSIGQPLDLLRTAVNQQLRELDKAQMSERELRDILQQLTTLGCVVPTLLHWRLKSRVWLTV